MPKPSKDTQFGVVDCCFEARRPAIGFGFRDLGPGTGCPAPPPCGYDVIYIFKVCEEYRGEEGMNHASCILSTEVGSPQTTDFVCLLMLLI